MARPMLPISAIHPMETKRLHWMLRTTPINAEGTEDDECRDRAALAILNRKVHRVAPARTWTLGID
jgi:hypothetical protein